ncbi:uncharacterized protein [Amphiura filiformis]|uniref:uncharacterized protein n=1 Tax=Amphiura filiformis TaxID=82378 RepID=UPI003B21E7A6
METTVTKQDAEKLNTERKPPMLITCGDILTADRFMLNIDGEVVHWDLSSFPDALMMLFASYYVFSIEYGEACTTMEFVQRCMVGINPDRGCKSAAKKKFRYSLNPKLLSLINSIQDYQTSVFLCEEADDGKH